MTERIWMYWENLPGQRRAPYLDLCLETVERHAGGMEVIVVDRQSASDWLPGLDRRVWTSLPTPVYRSDYIRTRLLHAYGGMWSDFDVIAMAPLSELLPPASGPDVVGWGAELSRFYNNLFSARRGAPFLEAWIDRQDEALSGQGDWAKLSYAALGQDIALPLARRNDYVNMDVRRVAPVLWYEWRRFLSPVQSPIAVLTANPITVVLWNKAMGPILGGRTLEQLTRGRELLSRLFRIALGQSTPLDESGGLTHLHALSSLRYSRAGRSLEYRVTSWRRAVR